MHQAHAIFNFMTKYIFSFIILIFLFIQTNAQEAIKVDSSTFFVTDSTQFILSPININSKNSDYSPVLYNNKMLFASDRENLIGVVYKNSSEKPLIDLYLCEKIDSINFKSEKPFSKTINTAYNDGPATFNANQSTIIFSSNSNFTFSIKKKKIEQKNLQLFQSEFKNNTWTAPVKLPFCKNEFSFTHPSLSSDGKTLFFSSNMNGGFGGMDLYYSTIEEGVWSKPINLGTKINSSLNEVFPFISVSNVLFFSSYVSGGFGGLDLYSFIIKDSSQSVKHLLDPPLNSISDDFGISADSEGNEGYISSNRNEINNDDIYFFKIKYPSIKNCTPFIAPRYCFTFYEESSDNSLTSESGSKLIYEWNLGDGTKIKNLEAKHCFKRPGNYNVELNIVEEASGALFYNQASYEFEVVDSEQVYINCPDTVATNAIININAYKSKISGSTILKYYWNLGDGNYSNGINGNYVYKNEGKYTIKLGLESKIDSSKQLQNSCVEKTLYVKNNFVPTVDSTLFYEPENKTIIYSTENVDSLNYRVFLGASEKQIPMDAPFFAGLVDVKEFQWDSLFLYTAGRKDKVVDLLPEYKKARANGLNASRVVAYSGDSILQNLGKLENIKIFDWMVNLKNNNPTFKEFSSNIYFSAFVDSIESIYYPTLDLIAEILKIEPGLTISIYAFTDTIGSVEFHENEYEMARLALSIQRGNVIKKYFEEKGIKIESIRNIPKNEHPIEDEVNLKKNIILNRRVTIYVKKKKA